MLLREGDSLPLVWTAADDFGVTESQLEIRKNKDASVRVAVTAVDGRYTYDVSDWKLTGGDRLHVRAIAADALGQRGESIERSISVAGGLEHREAQEYLRDLALLREQMAASEKDLPALRDARAGIFEAVRYETPSALENLEFNRARWPLLTDRFGQVLMQARSASDALRGSTFFRAGAPALELLSRYMEQERLRLQLSDPAILQNTPGVAGVYELGLPMLAELEKRAGLALPALQADRLKTMVSLVAPRTDPASRRLLEDLRHRAGIFAGLHAPGEVDRLQNLDLSAPAAEPARGLRRWIWMDRGGYIQDPGEAKSLVATDAKIEHPNLGSMGLQGQPKVAVLWMGRLRVEQSGTHRFELESDDGSRLYVGEKMVVQNDGNHAMQPRSGEIALTPGLHSIRVVYFNS
ncbi:MAG: PA14 domain-containing protein, partial [Pirellulales bacterium]